MKIGRLERTKLHVLDGFMAGELWNSLGISEENAPNFSRRQMGEGAGESGVEVLDDPDFPIRVMGRDPEDLGRALVLVADAEGALLVRVRVGGGLGLKVRGSFCTSG